MELKTYPIQQLFLSTITVTVNQIKVIKPSIMSWLQKVTTWYAVVFYFMFCILASSLDWIEGRSLDGKDIMASYIRTFKWGWSLMLRTQTSKRSAMAHFLTTNMSVSLETHQLTSRKSQAVLLIAGLGFQRGTLLQSSLLNWCHLGCWSARWSVYKRVSILFLFAIRHIESVSSQYSLTSCL